jgi:hypothetical protein
MMLFGEVSCSAMFFTATSAKKKALWIYILVAIMDTMSSYILILSRWLSSHKYNAITVRCFM